MLPMQFSISQARLPVQFEYIKFILYEHAYPLEAISDFARRLFEFPRSHLLEIRKLRYFQAVKPYLPSKPGCAQRRRLQVVLYEPHLVLFKIYPEGLKAGEVNLFYGAGMGLNQYLILIIILHPQGIVRKPGVCRPP